jgi:hypothetical protein
MSLALSSLGAVSTGQKVFKQSKSQEGSLSRRKKILLTFLDAKQRHSNGMRGFYFRPFGHCGRFDRHQSSFFSPMGKRQLKRQCSRSLNASLVRDGVAVVKVPEIRPTHPRIRNLAKWLRVGSIFKDTGWHIYCSYEAC